MSETATLPAPFSHLAPFVDGWALRSEETRYHKLHNSSFDELRAFYHAMLPDMDAILTYLNQFPVDDLPPEATTLFNLAMTFAETAHPIDLGWKSVDFPMAYPWDRLKFYTVSAEPKSA